MAVQFIKKVENFSTVFTTTINGNVYVRMDFGSFYEWYRYEDKSFHRVGERDAVSLEKAFRAYREDSDQNVIFFEKGDGLKNVAEGGA